MEQIVVSFLEWLAPLIESLFNIIVEADPGGGAGAFLVGVFVFGIGKAFIGKIDRRTTTGWRNNRKPKWIPGLVCCLAGIVLCLLGAFAVLSRS